MIDKLPCIDCICMPVCRNKQLRCIFSDCKLVTQHWRLNVSLHPVGKSAHHALSIVQDMSHCLTRILMPSYKDESRGKRFGLLDIDPKRHDSSNTSGVIETYKAYYLDHEIDLLKVEIISKPLNMILKNHEPFNWKIEYDRAVLERLSN